MTHASPPPADDGHAVLTDARIDGAALRRRHHAWLEKDRSPVTLLRGDSALALGQALCEQVVPQRPKDTPILLKPNMTGFNWFKNPATHGGDDGVHGRTTDPEFVRGVIRCLKARGHTRITVADGFGGEAKDWDRLIKVSGYAAMTREEGVALVALDDDGVYDVQGEQPGKPLGIDGMEHSQVPTLLMPKILAEHLDHGLFISLPKIKSHRFAVFSLGIKAMQGSAMYSDAAPAFRQKWRTHKEIGAALKLVKAKDRGARAAYVKSLETFATRIVDILEIEAPDVVLAEGAPIMSGDGFEVLEPSRELVALGGTNVILVDRVGAQLLGMWDNEALARELGGHRTSPLLEVAAARFGLDLGPLPKVVGNGADLLERPRSGHLVGMAGFEVGRAAPVALHAPHAEPSPEAWAAAPALAWATDWQGKPAGTRTTVRALWSEKGLSLRWELEGAMLTTDRSRPVDVERENLYEEDCVEVFLTPDAARPQQYFEIEVGPFGHFFDLAIDRTAKTVAERGKIAWSAGLQLETSQDAQAHTATITMTITAPEVLRVLVAGARLPVGFFRMQSGSPRLYLAAFPPGGSKLTFHVPEAFGRLVLDP